MNLEEITVELVEQTLRAWSQFSDPPQVWLQADFVITFDGTPVEKLENLHEFVVSHITRELRGQRIRSNPKRSLDLPNSYEELVYSLIQDFDTEFPALEDWSALYHRYIEDRFAPDVQILTRSAHVNERLFRRRVEKGIDRLALWIRQQEKQAHQAQRGVNLRLQLEQPGYLELVGSLFILDEIVKLLMNPTGSSLISIEGIGGIGKTAQAQAIAQRISKMKDTPYRQFIWVTFRQGLSGAMNEGAEHSVQWLMTDVIDQICQKALGEDVYHTMLDEKIDALTRYFAITPTLLIIDNLETVQDIDLLIPRLIPMTGTSRILITSRESLSHYPYVSCFSVPQLSVRESVDLLGLEFMRLGHKRRLTDEECTQIHQVVGGIPLALKLVAAQLTKLPLDVIMQEMRAVRWQKTEELFRYIYHKSWYLLKPSSRRLMLALVDIAPDGALFEWVQRMGLSSDLTETQFMEALDELRYYSMIEVNRSARTPIYSFHRLTITFLQTDLLRIRWNS